MAVGGDVDSEADRRMREGSSKGRARRTVDPGRDVVEAILTAHEVVAAVPVRQVAGAGFADVTPAMLAAMLTVPSEGIALDELRRAKGRSKQSASKVVEELRKRGYVELAASAADGRAKVVSPTARGRALREAGLEAGAALAKVAAEAMGDDASRVATLLLAFAGLLADPSRNRG